MRGTVRAWLRRRRRLLIREAILLACALTLGLGYGLWQLEAALPSIDGNIYSMLALEDSLLMVLSNGNRNSLVRIDHAGTLLNYMDTADGQAFQYLESDGETIYAILSYERDGDLFQRLVSLSLEDAAMAARPLAELTGLRGVPAGVVWREIYLPAGEKSPLSLELAGLDRQGRGCLAHLDLASGSVRWESILPGEDILFLKYVADRHYVWINRSREAGQYLDGLWQRDVLTGLSRTPLHISTCGTRCFISDSVSGDIFELPPDGTPLLLRQGEDVIGSSGVPYRQLEVYTTYLGRDGEVRIVGLCAAGGKTLIAGEDWTIPSLRPGRLWPLILWRRSWPAAALCWALLAALVEAVCAIAHAPRLSVRLLLCQVLLATALLTGVTAIQYRSFQETIREEAYQKLRLLGAALASSLSSGEQAGGEPVEIAVSRLERQAGMAMAERGEEYALCVVWDTDQGPVIASDSSVPAGYLLEDVKSREYHTAVSQVLLTKGGSALRRIQTDTSYDYVYAQSFVQGGRTGCVAISQGEAAMLAGRVQFLQRLLPILALCPLLFLALAGITRRLLRPLDEIQRALEEFYTCGSGGQMQLEGMPRTELYEVGRVFNQLSVQTHQ